MMRQLRQNTAVVLWIVIIAFVGLIVIEWGGDFSGQSNPTQTDNVGVINGREITIQEFRRALQNAASQQRASSGEEVEQADLVKQVWNALVNELLVSHEIERLGIQVTDSEIALLTREQPPPAVQQQEVFQTDGQFDPIKYQQFLYEAVNNKNEAYTNFILQIEALQEQQWRSFKLQQLLRETVQVSPPEVRQFYAEKNEKVEVEYLFASGNTVTDEEVEVGEADIRAYYEEHQHEYQHPEQVRLSHVSLAKVATAEDSLKIGEEIAKLHQEITDGADFAELAGIVSEDPASAAKGGDLGIFGRGRMVASFEEVAFALQPGQVSEPVQTQFGWHIIKVEERLEEDGEEKVRARHILLRFEASRQTEEALYERIQAFRTAAQRDGFAAAAQAMGLEVATTDYLKEGELVQALGKNTAWVVNFFLASEVGTISREVETDRGFWVAMLDQRRSEGVAPLAEMQQYLERIVKRDKKAEMAGKQLGAVRQQVQSGVDLQEAAKAANLEVRRLEPFSRADYVPGIGRKNAFVGTAFRLAKGELSDIVTSGQGAYLLRLVDKTAVDEAKFTEEQAQTESELLVQRQNEALQVWFTQLYETAQIEDNRHHFFTF
jgi:peptidyl-prolyl cis-trans isomerase D